MVCSQRRYTMDRICRALLNRQGFRKASKAVAKFMSRTSPDLTAERTWEPCVSRMRVIRNRCDSIASCGSVLKPAGRYSQPSAWRHRRRIIDTPPGPVAIPPCGARISFGRLWLTVGAGQRHGAAHRRYAAPTPLPSRWPALRGWQAPFNKRSSGPVPECLRRRRRAGGG